MHHNRVQSMTSEDQDHDHGYTDESSHETSSPKRRKVSASWANVSCQLCKTRKVKCDRTHPSCGWCTRNNALCQYKERKKPGLRAGYGRELEQRLDRLEGVLLRHEEMLARALGGIHNPSYNELQWSQPTTNTQSEAPCTFPAHDPEHTSCAASHMRKESNNKSYSNGQHHRNVAPSLPPIKTSHDRRPSVTFMNNPTSPRHHVMLSASQSPPQLSHSILKHTSQSSRSGYPPLPTPDTTNNSSSHSPQHVQDYLTHKSTLQTAEPDARQRAQATRRRHSFNRNIMDPHDERFPPWNVMHELCVQYFANLNSVLSVDSESSIFAFLANPQGSETDIRTILMAITIVAVKLLPIGALSEEEKEYCVKRCKEALASPEIQKTKEGAQALAILLLNCSGETEGQPGRETTAILRQVNERLWVKEKGEKKPQSPLSVNEMLCRP